MMKHGIWRKAVFVFLILPMISGCWNMRELEHMFYAHAIGIDYIDGQYKLYAQILDFSTLGKQEAGGSKSETTEGAWVGKGVGNSFQEAVHHLYATSQRRIYWGHLNSVVLSEAVLKHGIHEVVDQLTRYNEFRYTLWVFGTRNSVEEVLLASPILESSPVYSQLSDPEDVYEQSSFIPPKRLYQLITELREPGKTPLLPLIHLSKGRWVDKKTQYSALELEGVGIIKDGKWNGWLSKEDITGSRWLDRGTVRTPLVIDSDKQPAAVVIFEHPKPRIHPEMRNGKIYFNIGVTVKGSISLMVKEVSEAEIASRSEKLIGEEIRRTFKEGLKQKTDSLNLLDSFYRNKLPEWRKLTQLREFALDAESLQSIDVKVQITNSGRTVGPFSPSK
ncbi:Ger(x)C family spore germination protein [Cohnella algarum]|uniref:Ger(x)C family spore germination protein n=1 Tax=Cohnella algarum TaxID=2044859 RepID=UPI00196771F7|nr:Ger(x)C family spore germination protein [Cohnella algarum]MBN2982269.1 Ger(x)C family spore germination protein [Cohnella algarum]